ncbi:hypothetical protein [Paenibacillus radicis (ex Xue et al. 2023)]|uniref:Restriction endonuclease subunit S n=1 Tax=Paenibacillus radicis (ex Xue et al. 2023) TaxID=2972489 RepID=A0ABT1Y933_9BACL|nr:hypothetical protein [Paenibacillus radicis (ex Xue et al. 2023)]MCR8629686.1 hypothetical protein [Paenibacillus radicis (ex Xue et al. 2023)]
MSRTDSYHKMLQAAADFQSNIALILEAKSVEAARSCQWICQHLTSDHFESHSDQIKKTIEIHEQMLEVIDGMTKMELALAKNLQVLLGQSEDSDNSGGGGTEGGSGDLGDMFSFGGDSK